MLKNVLKSTARLLGFELRRFLPASSQAAQLRAMLLSHKVNLIFDVGANIGQYGMELRNHVGYRGRIVSFEPMRLAHKRLSKVAAKDRLWEVAKRTAIGEKQGAITINISSNSVSSSVLPMLVSHENAEPASRYKDTELVPLNTLDMIVPCYTKVDSIIFLKIDTQGYESQVLQGAMETLSRAIGVQLELSLIPLYAEQKLMLEMIEDMKAFGFSLWGIFPAFADSNTGRILQIDATFFKD